MWPPRPLILSLVLFAGMLAPDVFAKRVSLKVGDAAPAWQDLPGVDGKRHSLEDYKEAKAIVVIFTCESCPVAKSYEDRLEKLATDFSQRGIAFVAINPNKDADIENMKTWAKARKLPYDYLRDASQRVAKRFGALRTPEVFLLDRHRKIAYLGAIDDDVSVSGKPKKHYLRTAISAVLLDQEPPQTSTRAFGCAIRWK